MVTSSGKPSNSSRSSLPGSIYVYAGFLGHIKVIYNLGGEDERGVVTVERGRPTGSEPR